MPVKGDLDVIVNLAAHGAVVPEKGPVPKTNLFSGERGATSGPTSSKRIFTLIPLPPTYFKRSSSVSGSFSMVPLLKSTRSIVPGKFFIAYLLSYRHSTVYYYSPNACKGYLLVTRNMDSFPPIMSIVATNCTF
jgi:hypothetical protein